MPEFTVGDIRLDAVDEAGAWVTAVYTKNPPLYAVYGAAGRVNIQYADDLMSARQQRAALVGLNPLRGQINGLVDGWRVKFAERAARYDRRVADALIVACEGDVASAQSLLDDIKADAVAERSAKARYDYLLAAMIAVGSVLLVTYALLNLTPWLFGNVYPLAIESVGYGASAGAIGALFSIAIGISSRTILTDLHTSENRSDAILRVLVGLTSGAALVCILSASFVTFSIGGRPVDLTIPSGTAAPPVTWWMRLLVIGLVAGFSERFVPDLLARASASGAASPPQSPGSIPPTAPRIVALAPPPPAEPDTERRPRRQANPDTGMPGPLGSVGPRANWRDR